MSTLAVPIELLTVAEMARADAAAIAGGVPGIVLMEHAGRAVARAIRRRFRPRPTVVLCGPGNNGGDGFVVARRLHEAGWPVRVALLGERARLAGAAALAASRWSGPVGTLTPAAVARAHLVVDAVFGAGLARPVEGVVAETFAACRAPVVAVDLPSGVAGDTGAVLGTAPQAALTVTFFRLKPAHLLRPGRDLCGEVVCAEIGIPARVLEGIAPRLFRNDPALWRAALRRPDPGDHKYSRGSLTIVAGEAMTGAARLAARAARRAGAGLVTIACPDAASAAACRAGDPGVIVVEAPVTELLGDLRRQVWLVGPGGGMRAPATAAAILAAGRTLVADADALRGAPEAIAGAALVTPHEGEFARLFGPPAGRLGAARAAAARLFGAMLLKGSDTIIAAPDGRAAITADAPAWLATAGTGDVLAGIAAALIAQGMPPWEAGCAAAWAHAAAARGAGAYMIAEDLADHLPRVLAAV
ncbi:bifunctional ADP-dependent NAD(P)H-hydrate dehydratase/NAD(P)H-hydrate epimerase [Elioraea tepidiphila]|uniref:bifunctional ADP-dependent NAD(P)H-hydrate dehydratase/NAD(P)H-hydrate epimerase n=1 Tax=Elioraea tepidiphila TaxID=457934 RepID=UPI00035D3F5B|nr:bifunctional ADP-dependent NAD(P)H-hydrate dehydratase/NAD(P)H-hydrate epimerase [Elioraea tepidiphila]